jgi:hypothetical protein
MPLQPSAIAKRLRPALVTPRSLRANRRQIRRSDGTRRALTIAMTRVLLNAGRIATDVRAMLNDGELERADYAVGDLRAALGALPGFKPVIARALITLEKALERYDVAAARTAAGQLLELLEEI